MGLVTARTLSFSLGIPVAGVSTLDALAAGAPGAALCSTRGAGRSSRSWPGSTDASRPDDSSSSRAGRTSATARSATATRSRVPVGSSHRTRAAPRPLGPPPRRARARLRPAGGGGADLPARPRRREGARRGHRRSAMRLGHPAADARRPDAIERIEQRGYPTPWSRSMFAGELAKPSSMSAGRVRPGDDGPLAGYLIVSRYVDAWHVMNLAVDLRVSPRGIAPASSTRSSSAPRPTPAAATRSRSASRTRARSRSTSGPASSRPACGAATTPTIGRTR